MKSQVLVKLKSLIDFLKLFSFIFNMTKKIKAEELDFVLLKGTESVLKIKNLKLSNKRLEKDNFKLLTLALWCKNFDVLYFLAGISNYFEKASKNTVFKKSIFGLEKYDKDVFTAYQEIIEVLDNKKNMKKDIQKKVLLKKDIKNKKF